MEACQHQGSLGDAEGRAHLIIVCQLFVGIYHFHGSQVDAAQEDMRLLAGLDVSLQRRLSVQFYGDVHHPSAFHQTVGRRVGPSAGEVDAHRRASPDNLVWIDGAPWLLAFCQHTLCQSLAQQTECLVAVVTEHGVVDADHQRCVGRQRCRHGQLPLLELAGSIVQV